jgi:hypothetical protein
MFGVPVETVAICLSAGFTTSAAVFVSGLADVPAIHRIMELVEARLRFFCLKE